MDAQDLQDFESEGLLDSGFRRNDGKGCENDGVARE